MKILVGVPTYGAPSKPFIESLARIAMPADVTSYEHFVASGNFIPAQRELIVARATACGADVLIMCDDDMVLPPDAFSRLVSVLREQPRCGLAGALYYSRDGFRPLVVSNWDPIDTTTAIIPAFATSPVRVDGVGFGCVAIRMDAVRELEPLYFEAHVFVEPRQARVRVCDEDYLFCHRLRARGWDVILDAGLRCGHYDRVRDVVEPTVWEDPVTTGQERVVALVDGVPRLVSAQQRAARAGEFHQPARVSYVSLKID